LPLGDVIGLTLTLTIIRTFRSYLDVMIKNEM
jgi:hypothetical protein